MTDLERLRARDPKFLKELFENTTTYLLRILAAQKISGDAAEDLIQESWRVFFESLDSFQGKSQIRTYIAGILINRIREHRRQFAREIPEEDVEGHYAQAWTTEGWWKTPPSNPDRLMQNQEILKFIQECMEGLTPTQRDAFTLREVAGENSREICNILGVPVPHLGVLIFRAKEKLRNCLEGKMG